MNDKPICTLSKNAMEEINFRLGEFQGRRFIDMRVFVKGDGKDPIPTRKGLAVTPTCGRNFGRPWPRWKRH